MISWISENLGTIVIGAIVLTVVALIACSLRKKRQSKACHCAGGCGSCKGCP